MRIFYISEIIGKAGVWAVKKNIGFIKSVYEPDIIIAHADRATGAGGLGKQHAGYLKKMGIDCITGGDFIFQKKDLVEALPQFPFVLRPFNLPAASPGSGFRCFLTRKKAKVAVFSLLGRVGHHRLLADNPFVAVERMLPEVQRETECIIVDFSSFATAEKQSMGFFLSGKVSAVIGSGAGAATADCRLMNSWQNRQTNETATDVSADSCREKRQHKRTAFITDAGRTGSIDSVGGYAPEGKIREYRSGLFEYPQETWQHICVQGLHIELDDLGSALSVERVCIENTPG